MEKRIEDKLMNPYSRDEIEYKKRVNNKINTMKEDHDLHKPTVKYFGKE